MYFFLGPFTGFSLYKNSKHLQLFLHSLCYMRSAGYVLLLGHCQLGSRTAEVSKYRSGSEQPAGL